MQPAPMLRARTVRPKTSPSTERCRTRQVDGRCDEHSATVWLFDVPDQLLMLRRQTRCPGWCRDDEGWWHRSRSPTRGERDRTRGLLRTFAGIDGALLLRPQQFGAQRFGMRFPIDVAYLDGELRVLRTVTVRGQPAAEARVEDTCSARSRGGHVSNGGAFVVVIACWCGATEGPGKMRGGALVLVGTPIGNLGDLSPRAVEALAGADVVACEDTRRTGLLLQRAGIGRKSCSPSTTTPRRRGWPRCCSVSPAGSGWRS